MNYHDILGIGPKATESEIKKAYRKKAFEFHPDRNKSADAQEKFIEATIAYEYLLYGKLDPKPSNNTTGSNGSTTSNKSRKRPPMDSEEYKAWHEYMRQKAEAQSKKRYEEIKRETEAFKRTFFYPFAVLITLMVILASGAIAAGCFALPFIILINTGNLGMTLVGCFYWLLGALASRSTVESIKFLRRITFEETYKDDPNNI